MDKNGLSSLDKPPSLEKLVVNKLRRAIVTAVLAPGQPLDQEELGKRLGVSRTPVRQALRVLESEGLVEFSSKRGATVSELSVEEIREIFIIREMLEGPAASIGAKKRTASTVRKAETLLPEMEHLIDESSQWLMVDRDFHMTIYKATGLPRLAQAISNLRDDIDRYVRAYINTADNIRRSNDQHYLIFEAFAAGDSVACERYTHDHLKEVSIIFEEALRGR